MNIEYYQEQLQAKEDMLARTTQYLLEAKRKVVASNDVLSEIHRNLFESIDFAGVIQTALLPDPSLFREAFRDGTYQVINQLGIGGDCVLLKSTGDSTSFGLFDATGHGIPAAMLSISAIMILNELLAVPEQPSPAGILSEMNARLCATFNGKRSIAHLEGTLCRYVPEQDCFSYCSAKGKGILIGADGRLTDLHSSRHSIGDGGAGVYEVHTCSFLPGDKLLLYSDGLTDQFGGPRHKKFSKRRLKELLATSGGMSASELSALIFSEHKAWKNEREQTDDVSFLLISF